MKRNYYIDKITTGDLLAVIYSLGFDSPMNHLTSIEDELHYNGIKGNVFFDLLLSNGNTTDRFYSAFFDGNKLVDSSIHKVVFPPQIIKEKSLSFYHGKQKYLKNSVLNKAQRFLIKKGRHLRISGKK